jgi:hypothetical protein
MIALSEGKRQNRTASAGERVKAGIATETQRHRDFNFRFETSVPAVSLWQKLPARLPLAVLFHFQSPTRTKGAQ